MPDTVLNRLISLSTVALLSSASACTNPADHGGEPPGEDAGSDLTREREPNATAKELAVMADDEQSMTVQLFKALPDGDDNRAISPASLRIAFGMLYEGARTVTEAEVAEVMHFTLDKPRLHTAFNRIDLELASRNLPESGDVDGDDSVKLSLVNQMFGRIGVQWLDPFLDVLAVNYGSSLRELDFAGNAEGSRVAINKWVAGETFGRIPELLPRGGLSAQTTAVLINAIYLKAPWEHPFEVVDEVATFTLRDTSQVTAAMMQGVFDTTSYYKGPGVEAAELPLRGEELSVVFIVPDSGTFDTYLAGLDGSALGEVFAGLTPMTLDLSVPRFTFSTEFALSDTLMNLGMKSAFGEGADLSGLSEMEMWVAEVYHDTFIAADEKGIEAAAAAAIVLQDTDGGGAESGTRVMVDRPFLFAIRDRGTGSLLWFGRVLDPR